MVVKTNFIQRKWERFCQNKVSFMFFYLTFLHVNTLYCIVECIFVLSLGKSNFEQEIPKFKIVLVGMCQFNIFVDFVLICFLSD